MPDRSRIPPRDNDFNNYIVNTTAWLVAGDPPNWKSVRLMQAEIEKWQAICRHWIDNYKLYTRINKRTHTVTAIKNGIKKQFRKFAKPLLYRIEGFIASSGGDTSNLLKFRIKIRKRGITRRGKINGIAQSHATPLGSGWLRMDVRNSSEPTHKRMHPLADAILVAYHIGDTPPASPKHCHARMYSSRARFILEAGIKNSGKMIYIYTRYVNLSSPSLSGPFSNVISTRVP